MVFYSFTSDVAPETVVSLLAHPPRLLQAGLSVQRSWRVSLLARQSEGDLRSEHTVLTWNTSVDSWPLPPPVRPPCKLPSAPCVEVFRAFHLQFVSGSNPLVYRSFAPRTPACCQTETRKLCPRGRPHIFLQVREQVAWSGARDEKGNVGNIPPCCGS